MKADIKLIKDQHGPGITLQRGSFRIYPFGSEFVIVGVHSGIAQGVYNSLAAAVTKLGRMNNADNN